MLGELLLAGQDLVHIIATEPIGEGLLDSLNLLCYHLRLSWVNVMTRSVQNFYLVGGHLHMLSFTGLLPLLEL